MVRSTRPHHLGATESHPLPTRSPRRWWLVVLVFFVAGDLLTTGAGYAIPGVIESNRWVDRLVLDHGLLALPAIKLGVVGVGYLVARRLPAHLSVGIPAGFGLVGVCVTAWNLAVIAVALGP